MTRDNPTQVAAAEIFVEKGAWVPHLVLAEATWVLDSVYDRSPQAIALAVEMLLDHEHLTIQDPETVTAAIQRFREHPNVGFSDCLILETSRRAGHLPLGSFDHRLGKLPDTERLRG
jgi:predicted nucleic-acid-binding protein